MQGFTDLYNLKLIANIPNNIQDKYLISALIKAQDIQLRDILGDKLYEHLQEHVEYEEYGEYEEEAILVDDLFQMYLAFQTMANLVQYTTFKIDNQGANRTTTTNTLTADWNEAMKVQSMYQEDANKYAKRIQNYINQHYDYFKEWIDYKPNQDNPNLDASDFSCPIYLGGKRNKK